MNRLKIFMRESLNVHQLSVTATGDFWLARTEFPLVRAYTHCYLESLHDMLLWCIDWKLGLQVAFWRLRHEGIWISSRFLIKIPHELAGVIVTWGSTVYLSSLFSHPRVTLSFSYVLQHSVRHGDNRQIVMGIINLSIITFVLDEASG